MSWSEMTIEMEKQLLAPSVQNVGQSFVRVGLKSYIA